MSDLEKSKKRVEEISNQLKELDIERWRLVLKGAMEENPDYRFTVNFSFGGLSYSRHSSFREIVELAKELENERSV